MDSIMEVPTYGGCTATFPALFDIKYLNISLVCIDILAGILKEVEGLIPTNAHFRPMPWHHKNQIFTVTIPTQTLSIRPQSYLQCFDEARR
jgi:hypothetical protein